MAAWAKDGPRCMARVEVMVIKRWQGSLCAVLAGNPRGIFL